jgi:HKD family nuclease
MAQPAPAAEMLKLPGEFPVYQFGLTGDTPAKEHLLDYLRSSIRNAERIDIIVSFLMVSGINQLIDDLAEASARGVKIRILTGTYLGITPPEALYLLKDKIRKNLDLRIYGSP